VQVEGKLGHGSESHIKRGGRTDARVGGIIGGPQVEAVERGIVVVIRDLVSHVLQHGLDPTPIEAGKTLSLSTRRNTAE